jgi:hypothetical protein
MQGLAHAALDQLFGATTILDAAAAVFLLETLWRGTISGISSGGCIQIPDGREYGLVS